jgi:predicted RNA-binding Zn-ribbon protein involved in translation (DUF1610 family)
MSEPQFRNEVANPCPTCGKRFDFNGCMTFVDEFLERATGGKCPNCGTLAVTRVPDRVQPDVWVNATALDDIRIRSLWLSVRTMNVLEHVGIATVGDLLDSTEERIQSGPKFGDSVLREVRALLTSKGLALRAERQ